MVRDRQIFVRTTQEAYDWVAAQAEAAGLSYGALVSEVLQMAARQGWVLERPRIAVTGKPVEPEPAVAPPVAFQEPVAPQAQTEDSGSRLPDCRHPGVGRKQRCPKCGRYNL